jgi:uncharacterized protein YihD (DUF1040 family)
MNTAWAVLVIGIILAIWLYKSAIRPRDTLVNTNDIMSQLSVLSARIDRIVEVLAPPVIEEADTNNLQLHSKIQQVATLEQRLNDLSAQIAAADYEQQARDVWSKMFGNNARIIPLYSNRFSNNRHCVSTPGLSQCTHKGVGSSEGTILGYGVHPSYATGDTRIIYSKISHNPTDVCIDNNNWASRSPNCHNASVATPMIGVSPRLLATSVRYGSVWLNLFTIPLWVVQSNSPTDSCAITTHSPTSHGSFCHNAGNNMKANGGTGNGNARIVGYLYQYEYINTIMNALGPLYS